MLRVPIRSIKNNLGLGSRCAPAYRCLALAAPDRSGARVAIVGSGPSGFYTAKYLLKAPAEHVAEVTIIEQLPVPFGLVRFGVAPDHPEVKNVEADFSAVAEDPRFKFCGHVALADPNTATETSADESEINGDGGSSVRHEPKPCPVSLAELRERFDAVVLAYGADADRRLKIPGESTLEGVFSARTFVSWYNGLPGYAHLGPQIEQALKRSPHVVILGHGNVALDCARILAKAATTTVPTHAQSASSEEAVAAHVGGEEEVAPSADAAALAATDICTHATDTLFRAASFRHSTPPGEAGDAFSKVCGVKRISVVGRRGGAQANFTIKELRELTRLGHGVELRVNAKELTASSTEASKAEVSNTRPKQRLYKLLESHASEDSPQLTDPPVISVRFLLAPVAIEEPSPGADVVSGVTFQRTQLEGPPGSQKAVPEPGADPVTLDCGLVLTSVGWQSVPADSGVPFDNPRGVVPTAGGEKGPRVLANNQEGATIVPGLYAAGWLKRGPSGIIGSNVTDGKEASAAVLADYLSEASLNLPDSEVKVGNGNECSSHSKKGYDALKALVTERTAAQSRAEKSQLPVSWNAWQAIDATEVAQGEQIEKPRAKLTSVADLLSAAVGNPE